MFSRSRSRRLTDRPRRVEALDRVIIRSDVQSVWAAVIDPNVVFGTSEDRMHVAPGTGPPDGIGVGSVYVIVRPAASGGAPTVSSWQVTAFDAPRSATMVFLHRRTEVRLGIDVEVTPHHRGTVFAVTGWFEISAGVNAAKAEEYVPTFRRQIDRVVDLAVTETRRHCEKPTRP